MTTARTSTPTPSRGCARSNHGCWVIWGKYDLSFELSEPEAYRQNVPNAEVHVLDAGHFALDTRADEIAALVDQFMKAQK
jgi:pimeloyl-ACP methyl ester carboxylesterase